MKKLRVHYFQHVSFEGIGYIEEWVSDREHTLSSTKFYAGQKAPRVDDIDWLIVLGGPMNIYQEREYPWLVTEKEFIKEAIRKGKTVIGFCLGGQLIASALKAGATTNPVKEIGWFPITFSKDICTMPAFKSVDILSLSVFHWHENRFEIPTDAKHIAKSAGCDNQGFIYKDNVIAFQFHLETTLDCVINMIENCSQDYEKKGAYIQSPEKMYIDLNTYVSGSNKLLATILDNLADI